MKKTFAGLAVSALALGALSTLSAPSLAASKAKAYGKTAHPPAHAKAHAYGRKRTSAPRCSVCGMTLSTRKTKAHSVPMRVNGKTYYCCAACKMKANSARTRSATVKKAAAPICPMCKVAGRQVRANGKTKYVCPACKMTVS